jgi:hypothetical protein
MVRPNKKQKVGDNTTYKEEVLFNNDTLSKIISYLPSVDVLNLSLTCTRFEISNTNDDDSIIKESTRIAIQDIATEEQLAALPHYDGENSLADYHYLQLMRGPLAFDQLIGAAYVNSEDKTCVMQSNMYDWDTALSNNILRAGKHYVSFTVCIGSRDNGNFTLGVIRPGQWLKAGTSYGDSSHNPMFRAFSEHFSLRIGRRCNSNKKNSSIDSCLYSGSNGNCYSNTWGEYHETQKTWDGMEGMSRPGEDTFGMLLDLDEGTLAVYKNDRKLGVMKRGLAGQYCWVASMWKGTRVTIKRGTIPPS